MDKNYYYCVDVGGTFIKAGIIFDDGQIFCLSQMKTKNQNSLAKNIINIVRRLENKSRLNINNASGLGIGVPGMIDNNSGTVLFSGNLNLKNYPLLSLLENEIKIPIKISNDAEVATLAELFYGEGKNHNNFVMITIGTGIGGGIVVNSNGLRKFRSLSSEIGHMKITNKKVKCSCGEFGCFEALASTKALISMTSEAMKKNTNSKLWDLGTTQNVDGKTIFDFKDIDETAKNVFEQYIQNLGDGIVNLVNILDPEVIVLGGAISAQGEKLITPLEKYVNKHTFKSKINQFVKIKTAKIAGNSGILGAKCLFN